MKNRIVGIVLTVLMACALTRASRAEGVKDLATIEGPGVWANWIALSADGTRLAVVRHNFTIPGNGRQERVPTEFEIWDVDRGTKVCSGTTPTREAHFTHVMFSANGKTLVTVDQGFGNQESEGLGGSRVRARGRGGYQAWDTETGREIGSAIMPKAGNEFTGTAVSPDGKYLATVQNGHSLDENANPTRDLVVREVTVWDLNAHKPRWQLKGVKPSRQSPTGDYFARMRPPASVNFLAFSPDGGRLALYHSSSENPSSEKATAPVGHRPGSINPLRLLLTLNHDKGTPEVAELPGSFTDACATIAWPNNGKFFILRRGRAIEPFDPTTGKSKGRFVLTFPRPPAPQRSGKALPAPTPVVLDPTELPDGWSEWQSVRSADGGRFASLFAHGPGVVQTIIWNTPARKVLGVIELPHLTGDKRAQGYTQGISLIHIALSGNGGRLAVSDSRGTVRVYDVSKISGLTRVQATASKP
jgi:WD40 repeat protein